MFIWGSYPIMARFSWRAESRDLLVLEGFLQRGGWPWLTVGTRTLAAEVLGSTPWREPSQSPPLATLLMDDLVIPLGHMSPQFGDLCASE